MLLHKARIDALFTDGWAAYMTFERLPDELTSGGFVFDTAGGNSMVFQADANGNKDGYTVNLPYRNPLVLQCFWCLMNFNA